MWIVLCILSVSLAINVIAIVVLYVANKENARLLHRRIVNNARRKVAGRKYRALLSDYNLLFDDYQKIERQPRIVKSDGQVLTVSESFCGDKLPMLTSGMIICPERKGVK